MGIFVSQNVSDAILSGRVGSAQCAQIAKAINKFSTDASIVEDVEIVFIDNVTYSELLGYSSGTWGARQGFYSDGSPKLWIASSWKNGCNGKNGPKVFTGKSGNKTEWVSLRTYLR